MVPAEPVSRRAVRVVVLAPGERTLLLLYRHATTGKTYWVTPGGGVEAGETDEAAIRRELHEELGAPSAWPLGPCVWTREHVFEWNGTWYRQQEKFYLMLVPSAFVPQPQVGPAQLAHEGIAEFRWWGLWELLAAGGETFAPRRFPELLAALLRDGPPGAPVDVGV